LYAVAKLLRLNKNLILQRIHEGLAFDHNDATLLNTAFVPDDASIIFDFNGALLHGLDAIRTQLLDFVGPMYTTHMISNVRIDLQAGGHEAQLNCYALAQHCLKREGIDGTGKKYLAASEDWIDMIKVGGAGGSRKGHEDHLASGRCICYGNIEMRMV
jgi:hypothetical protein